MVGKSLKELIRDADDLISQTREIPEWSVTIELRSPTVARRRDILKQFTDNAGNVDLAEMQLALLREMTFDPALDARIFDDDDMEWLLEKSGAVVWAIAEDCLQLAGFTEEAEAMTDAGKAPS